jgi:uncharacterized Zn finger protein
VPLACETCGSNAFRLRRADGGAEAECINCGTVIPDAVLRAATRSEPDGYGCSDKDEQPPP